MATPKPPASHDEIPETTADPAIAALYADIRQVSGLPGINLFYRRLAYAGTPVLAAFWEQVRPLYETRRLHQAGQTIEQLVTLPGVCTLDGPLLKAAGVDRDHRASVRATLRYFNRANAMHLVLFSVLTQAMHGTGSDLSALLLDPLQDPPVNGDDELLALPAWEDTPPASQVLVAGLRDRLAPGLADTIRPTLLRHFAPYPVLLAALYGYVACHNDALVAAIESSRTDALRAAKTLHEGVTVRFDAEVQAAVETTTAEFRQIIPVMLVLGTAMARGF
jgi:hypothetical protein